MINLLRHTAEHKAAHTLTQLRMSSLPFLLLLLTNWECFYPTWETVR